MEIVKLDKPDVSRLTGKALDALKHDSGVMNQVKATIEPEYLFWDKVKYKPRPDGVSAEVFWALVKLFRNQLTIRNATPITAYRGASFSWYPLPALDYFLHEVDMNLGGSLVSGTVDTAAFRQASISRGIMEEAIASSQLEGASTTRKVAKRMLLEKRRPRNRSEQMILNNYNVMLRVEQELQGKPLTVELLKELQAELTKGTIDEIDIGRFRSDKDKVVVEDAATGSIFHIPPPVSFVKAELRKLVRYANSDDTMEKFVHPVTKGILLHFWIGYLHPFADGNGRLARSIFYWYLLRKHYWGFSYLPLSRVIKNSPAQYRDAYLYSEQDDNDVTYFIDYNVRKIMQARREFEVYVRRKEQENLRMTTVARDKYGLNDRQIQLLRYLYKNAEATTTMKTHAQVYGVGRVTARRDLERLESLGLLQSWKRGVERPFKATEKVAELLS